MLQEYIYICNYTLKFKILSIIYYWTKYTLLLFNFQGRNASRVKRKTQSLIEAHLQIHRSRNNINQSYYHQKTKIFTGVTYSLSLKSCFFFCMCFELCCLSSINIQTLNLSGQRPFITRNQLPSPLPPSAKVGQPLKNKTKV